METITGSSGKAGLTSSDKGGRTASATKKKKKQQQTNSSELRGSMFPASSRYSQCSISVFIFQTFPGKFLTVTVDTLQGWRFNLHTIQPLTVNLDLGFSNLISKTTGANVFLVWLFREDIETFISFI